jgi:predicted amidohydrolase
MTGPTVAVAQAPSLPGKLGDNARQAVSLIAAAAEGGASLVVLPELFLSGYDVPGIIAEPADHVVTPGDEICARLQNVCANLSIGAIVGGAVGLGEGIANGALVIAPDGSLIHVYRKVRLWGEEARAFVPGARPILIDLPGLRVGLSVCFDAGFPEHFRALTLAGAELIACPSAFAVGEERHRYDLYFPMRALENTVYVAVANAVGTQGGIEMFGDSSIFSPRGHPLCRIESPTGVAATPIDRGELERTRTDLPYLRELARRAVAAPEVVKWR